MTGRALFSIKLIGSHLEHVVALDAHAVEDAADHRAGLPHRLPPRLVLINRSARGHF